MRSDIDEIIYFMSRIIEDFHIKSIISAIGTFLIFMLGGLDASLQFFLWILLLDFITGTVRAISIGNLNSSTGRCGIKKVFLYLVVISLAHSLETIGIIGMRAFVLIVISLTEASSVVENLENLGLEITPISNRIDNEKKKNKRR